MDQLTEYFAGKPGKAIVTVVTIVFFSIFIYRLSLEIKLHKQKLTEA